MKKTLQIPSDVERKARMVASENKVAIFIVAYNAERHIEKVLNRIPSWLAEKLAEVYIIDDHSKDSTSVVAKRYPWPGHLAPLFVYRTPSNRGYGGNQKLGYSYAINKGFDIVVLLHGDGQYAPEALPFILAAYADGADASFGSRFLTSWQALKGGMPVYKFVGNRILTWLQNMLLGTQMSEMHSGYRSYHVSALKKVPFLYNSNGFDFDADIIVQFVAAGLKIHESPIPTFYGDEICHVNGLDYAWKCVKTALKFRLMGIELFYDPKFDIRTKEYVYTRKESKTSLHAYMRSLPLPAGANLLDVGGGDGAAVSRDQAARGVKVTCIDQYESKDAPREIEHHKVDLDKPWVGQIPAKKYETIFALDVIEHLQSPEAGLREIHQLQPLGGKAYLSTGNIGFLPMRIMLLLGQFNYGRRGILDLTHKRLFTVDSFRRLVENHGYKVDRIVGFNFPVLDLAGKQSLFLRFLDFLTDWFAKKWPRLFAFQFTIEATRLPSHEFLMSSTFSPQAGRDSLEAQSDHLAGT